MHWDQHHTGFLRDDRSAVHIEGTREFPYLFPENCAAGGFLWVCCFSDYADSDMAGVGMVEFPVVVCFVHGVFDDRAFPSG